MSYTVFTVSQLAAQIGCSSAALRTRIDRNALPPEVTAQRVGNMIMIYVPQGKRIERRLPDGSKVEKGSSPGRSVVLVLVDSDSD